MGGHGGLNILPQKSWHVYNSENKQKVLKDEQQHAEEQEAARQKNEQAEREFRRKLLLGRARQRSGAQDQSSDVPPPQAIAADATQATITAPAQTATTSPAEITAKPPPSAQAQAHAPHRQRTAQQQQQHHEEQQQKDMSQQEIVDAKPPRLEHINFFIKEEMKAKHDEEEAERRAAKARRGNPETQTSDARFDEKFQFAHKLFGDEAKPWYAKRPKPADRHPDAQGAPTGSLLQGPQGAPLQLAPAADARVASNQQIGDVGVSKADKKRSRKEKPSSKSKKKRKRYSGSSSSSDWSDSSGESDSSSSSDSRGKKRRKKHKKRSKKDSRTDRGTDSKKLIAQLRQERLAREVQERERQQQVVEETLAAKGVPLGNKRYHSGFGNAPKGPPRATWHGRK